MKFLSYGRYAVYLAAASLIILGCSQNAPMGSLSSVAPSQRAAAALVPGAGATFEQRAAASGASPECFHEAPIAYDNGAIGQEQAGFKPNAKCIGIKKIAEVGNRKGSAFSQVEWQADQPPTCAPSSMVELNRGAGSYAELRLNFGSLANQSLLVLNPKIVGFSGSVGSSSIAIIGDYAIVRVLLGASMPLQSFSIKTGLATAYGEQLACNFVVPAAPETPVVFNPPQEPVTVPAPDSNEPAAPEAPVVAQEPPAPEVPAAPEAPAAPEVPVIVVADPPAAPQAPVIPDVPAAPEIPVVVVEPPVAPAGPAIPAPEGEAEAPQAPAGPVAQIPEAPEVPVAPPVAPQGPAEEPVAEAPAAPAAPPAPAEEPPVVADAPVPPPIAPPAPAEEVPVVFGPPVPPPIAPEAPAEEPPVVADAPVPPPIAPPAPPEVVADAPVEPPRNPASVPELPAVDGDADDDDQIDGTVVIGDEEAPAGGPVKSPIEIRCVSNDVQAHPGSEVSVEFEINRPLSRRENDREHNPVKATFRVHSSLEGLVAERRYTKHMRSLSVRIKSPSAIGFLQRTVVEASIGGSTAACTITHAPGYLGDNGSYVPLNGGHCGQSSIGYYAAKLSKEYAEVEVFFADKKAASAGGCAYSQKSGKINLDKDIAEKLTGPFSKIIRVRRSNVSSVLDVQYRVRDGAGYEYKKCSISVPELDAIAGEPAPVYSGVQGATGLVYQLPANTKQLYTSAQLDKMAPVSKITMSLFDVSARRFEVGFPGVKNVYEWFQLRVGREKPEETQVANVRIFAPVTAKYTFRTNSDDGVIFGIDGKRVIDHDGQHAPSSKDGSIELTAGYHNISLRYFQGPRYQIALELFWKSDKQSAEYDLGSTFKLVPAKAFYTDPQEVMVGL